MNKLIDEIADLDVRCYKYKVGDELSEKQNHILNWISQKYL